MFVLFWIADFLYFCCYFNRFLMIILSCLVPKNADLLRIRKVCNASYFKIYKAIKKDILTETNR